MFCHKQVYLTNSMFAAVMTAGTWCHGEKLMNWTFVYRAPNTVACRLTA